MKRIVSLLLTLGLCACVTPASNGRDGSEFTPTSLSKQLSLRED